MKINKGFSLVELSVVLIIIAAIIAGINGGMTIFKSAQLNGIIAEKNNLLTSVQNFKAKYNYLPGDIPASTGMMPPIRNAINNSIAHSSPYGNGDGYISLYTANPAVNLGYEGMYGIYHLYLLGFLENGYLLRYNQQSPYIYAPSSAFSENTALKAKFPNGVFAFFTARPVLPLYIPCGSSSGFLCSATTPVANYLLLGAVVLVNNQGAYNTSALLTVNETFSLDRKVDDGRPGTGKVVALNGAASGNAGTSNPIKLCHDNSLPSTDANYNTYNTYDATRGGTIDGTGEACTIAFAIE